MLVLKEYTTNSAFFFQFLPSDWALEIEPYWNKYQASSQIFVLEEHNQIVAGGIVFSTLSPDTLYYGNHAQKWFQKGYLYIGFLFVCEQRRNEGLGSKWVQEVRQNLEGKKLWLAIDDYGLVNFYSKLGFELVDTLEYRNRTEWVMAEPE
ncbi:MAG: GNAT family N-acetyltransferase [Bacteroidota bacterium]|nr:MAG: GNAT family N-acetyltransferase [Bacteroidota bacterium]